MSVCELVASILYLRVLLAVGVWSPRKVHRMCWLLWGEPNVVQLRAPRRGGGQHHKRFPSSRSDPVLPTPAPLRSFHWKIFPDLLTSQPCHLPAAAWKPKEQTQRLTLLLLGGRSGAGQLGAWVKQSVPFSLFFFFFFPLTEEKKDYN